MNDLQKIGGIAALVNAFAYIIGFGMVATILAPIMDAKPEQYLAFMVNNQTLMVIWNIIIYLMTGVFIVPLALALHARLNTTLVWKQTTTAFGLIWATTIICSGMIIINNIGITASLYSQDPTRATTIFLALTAIEKGLGGAIELPGGLWILLVSCAALQTNKLPRFLNYLGITIGISGILTVLPVLNQAAYVFGLGAILWFIWIGITMLHGQQDSEISRKSSLKTNDFLLALIARVLRR